MVNHAAPIVEIFDSIQGEGKFIGVRQIFVRLAGCPLDCPYCDTDHKAATTFTFEDKVFENPIKASDLLPILNSTYSLNEYHSISFTGGEPLIHSDFLKKVSSNLNAGKFLETSGHDPKAILEIEPFFDYISVDLKGTISPFENHADKLLSAIGLISSEKIYVKMPLYVKDSELVKIAAPLFKKYSINQVWLQPVDNLYDLPTIAEWQYLFARYGVDARFIPQMHKLMEIP